MTKCQTDPTCGIFLKRGLSKDIKNDIPMCQTLKYKNTNTQIQHITKCQKDPTCGIFLKRGLFKGIKNYIPMCQMRKYKIKCQKDSTCGILLKRRLFKDIFWISHSCTRSSSLYVPLYSSIWTKGLLFPLGSLTFCDIFDLFKIYLKYFRYIFYSRLQFHLRPNIFRYSCRRQNELSLISLSIILYYCLYKL